MKKFVKISKEVNYIAFTIVVLYVFFFGITKIISSSVNQLTNALNSNEISSTDSSDAAAKATKEYNKVIQKNHDETMDQILSESEKKVTATIFLGILPATDDDTVSKNIDFLKKLDQTSIPHNWMFPNVVSTNGMTRWDKSNNTNLNADMYQELNIPHYTSKDALLENYQNSNSPTSNFAYEIVLWFKRQPIAVYQCTTDVDSNHTKIDYLAGKTILNIQIDPNNGEKITYTKGQALFLRNKGNQERWNSVSSYYGVGNERPDLKFIRSN